MMVLPANYYGVKGYPAVISLMMVVGTTAGALGARIAGMVFDRVHSYTPVFYCVAGLSVLASIVLLLMKPARKSADGVAVTAA
jgi:predicted MFS family arabinose efflux permease